MVYTTANFTWNNSHISEKRHQLCNSINHVHQPLLLLHLFSSLPTLFTFSWPRTSALIYTYSYTLRKLCTSSLYGVPLLLLLHATTILHTKPTNRTWKVRDYSIFVQIIIHVLALRTAIATVSSVSSVWGASPYLTRIQNLSTARTRPNHMIVTQQ